MRAKCKNAPGLLQFSVIQPILLRKYIKSIRPTSSKTKSGERRRGMGAIIAAITKIRNLRLFAVTGSARNYTLCGIRSLIAEALKI